MNLGELKKSMVNFINLKALKEAINKRLTAIDL